MTSGVDSDALVAAGYSFLEEGKRVQLAKSLDDACGLFGGRADIVEIDLQGQTGHRIDWKLRGDEIGSTGTREDTMNMITKALALSPFARKMTEGALGDLSRASNEAMKDGHTDCSLNGVELSGQIMDLAAFGKFADMIGLRGKYATGSYISIGEKWLDGEKGEFHVPSPVSARLLTNMRFRFGPSEGDFAGPGGIAIVRQILCAQDDTPPRDGRVGVGFGHRAYDGRRLSVRIIEGSDGD